MSPQRAACFFGAVTLLLFGNVPSSVEAQSGPQAVQQSQRTVRPPTTATTPQNRSRAGYRRHGQYRGAQRPPARPSNRHLISPLGSAANVRRGGYQEFYGTPESLHGAAPLPIGGYYPPAYVVYVDTVVEPPVYGEPSRAEPQVEVQPTPSITIINQPPAPAPAPLPTASPTPPTTALPPIEPRRRSTEPRQVFLEIRPADAQVLIDDEPLGSALELTTREPLNLPPGVYILEVTHPAFSSQRLVFGVDAEDGAHVVVDLTASKPSRRTRVR